VKVISHSFCSVRRAHEADKEIEKLQTRVGFWVSIELKAEVLKPLEKLSRWNQAGNAQRWLMFGGRRSLLPDLSREGYLNCCKKIT
jgi:hypothetical protein